MKKFINIQEIYDHLYDKSSIYEVSWIANNPYADSDPIIKLNFKKNKINDIITVNLHSQYKGNSPYYNICSVRSYKCIKKSLDKLKLLADYEYDKIKPLFVKIHFMYRNYKHVTNKDIININSIEDVKLLFPNCEITTENDKLKTMLWKSCSNTADFEITINNEPPLYKITVNSAIKLPNKRHKVVFYDSDLTFAYIKMRLWVTRRHNSAQNSIYGINNLIY